MPGWGDNWGADWGNNTPAVPAGSASDISRTPVTVAILTLDFCQLTFGQGACLATGTPCYNTFPTCKWKTAYSKGSKNYTFTSNPAVPWMTGERPYLSDVQYMATEISDNFTVSSTTQVVFLDEPDGDIGIDPYVSQRAGYPNAIQGTFWQKLVARNRNYTGRMVTIYEGFAGQPQSAYVQTFRGTITNITLEPGQCTVEAADALANLAKINVPPKITCSLVAGATTSTLEAADTIMTVSDVTVIPVPMWGNSPLYLVIDSEIIGYSEVIGASNQIAGLLRGQFGTTAASHSGPSTTGSSGGAKVCLCQYYAPQNPFSILQDMLLGIQTDAGAFTYWYSYPKTDVNFAAIIAKPTKLSDLYFEIVDQLDCKSWVNEAGQVTIARNIPNQPGRSYSAITDRANIVLQTPQVDLNDVRQSGDPSRITRCSIYWGLTNALGSTTDPTQFAYLNVSVDEDAESADGYGAVVEKQIFSRWIGYGQGSDAEVKEYVANLAARTVWRQRDALPIITLQVEIKDMGILTGDWVYLSTARIRDIYGNPLSAMPFQVVKRQRKRGSNKLTLKLLQGAPRRIMFAAPSGTPNYSTASAAQREYGFASQGTASGNPGTMPDGSGGYCTY